LSLIVVPSPSEALQPFSAVVLTGGSSGIGKSFIELGRKLKPELRFCNLSRRPPDEKISTAAGKFLNHFPCDLSDATAVERGAAAVREYLARELPTGRVLLINNSGIGAFGRFPEPDLGQELKMIDLNVRAVVQLTGLLLPELRQRGGAIMNIASTVGFQPTPLAATYGATKAFVLNWTIALNEELRGTQVRAIAVCPGTTRTDFFDRAGVGGGAGAAPFAMTSEDVVREALSALGAGRPQVVTGWRNKVLTFIGAKAPKPLAARISGRIIERMRFGASGAPKDGAR
jgi:short-subunit dehydrogenase